MTDATFRRFLEAVETARSSGQAWEAASAFVEAAGAPRLRVTLHGARGAAGPQVVHFSGFDAEAERRLDRACTRHDPAAALALTGAAPFALSRFPDEASLAPAAQEALLTLRAAAGGDLTFFAVFGPEGCDAVCGLGHPLRGDPCEDALHRIRAACQIAHLQALRSRAASYPGPTLTDRELEILRWIVHAKSNAAIAEILGCSAHTVDTHVRRIFAKLDVSDRTSASLRAVDRGLVKL